MSRFKIIILSTGWLLAMVLLNNCQKEEPIDASANMFERLPLVHTGVDFNNEIIETPKFNHYIWQSMYDGAGVGVGDINNDNLPDLFFSGNKVKDRLYINKGKMQFEDISDKAGLIDDDRWSSGVTMADVNDDGLLDIYVCRFGPSMDENERRNLLYINNGNKTFTERAKEYGLDNGGFSIQATFFDFDNDNDLDLYLVNQPPDKRYWPRFNIKSDDKNPIYSDRLFRNDGGAFKDISQNAGINNFAAGLNAVAGDVNNDGWVDIYVSNDFEKPDFLYINQGNGTFKNQTKEALKHVSWFSMGSDMSDYNNDGLLDILAVDMAPEDHFRSKTNMGSMNLEQFQEFVNRGYHYQYMFNTLQLNNGNGHFSEVGQLAGMSKTDWSWAALFVDLDNDGYKDIAISNGIKKDIRNNDVAAYMKQQIDQGNKNLNPMALINAMPSVPLPNYLYRNNGDLTFTNVTQNWNFSQRGYSNGMSYADLDNDGDLDLVLSNVNEPASIYQNVKGRLNNYLRVKLIGKSGNRFALNTRVSLNYNGTHQTQELTLTRGYLSSVEPVLHFGLGKNDIVDELIVKWPDGTETKMEQLAVNKVITIDQNKATGNKVQKTNSSGQQAFKEQSTQSQGIDFQHQENEFDDFSREILLPHKQSQNGPYIAKGDINGDQLEDFFIGGALGQSGVLYMGTADGFERGQSQPWMQDSQQEDLGCLFFDADTDGDLDLYVVSGGSEFNPGSSAYQDRLYTNDGQGNFSKSGSALPRMFDSGQVVKAADFDGDGDQDLLVGGRVLPGKYPAPPDSYLLLNEQGRFVDATEQMAPQLRNIGMVTDAVWVDYDKDNDLDLVVVGEWMPISILRNDGQQFSLASEEAYVDKEKGWWWSIVAEDFDQDGDIDFVAGNLGGNHKFKASKERPFIVYASDFDKTGTNDIVLAKYSGNRLLPVRGRECTSEQMPFVADKFPTFEGFAKATVEDVFSPEELTSALKYEVTTFKSVFLKNNGANQYSSIPLPNSAQISPLRSLQAYDVNKDGHLDILGVGNLYQAEVETVRYDAGVGVYLLGDGKGNFEPQSVGKSGFFAPFDARDLVILEKPNLKVLVANNNGEMQIFKF